MVKPYGFLALQIGLDHSFLGGHPSPACELSAAVVKVLPEVEKPRSCPSASPCLSFRASVVPTYAQNMLLGGRSRHLCLVA